MDQKSPLSLLWLVTYTTVYNTIQVVMQKPLRILKVSVVVILFS